MSSNPVLTQPNSPSTATPGHLPGDGHMWVMVLGDLVIFGAYFLIFMIYRAMHPDEFLRAQQHLDITIGVVNTVILLTSSWLVARAVLAARAGRHEAAVRLTWAGGLGGVMFMACKGYEWVVKIGAGHTNSEMFYSFYYVLTGVHLIHVLIGLIALAVIVRELRNPSRRRASVVEASAVYWHMVDLLWVIIFGLLYVVR